MHTCGHFLFWGGGNAPSVSRATQSIYLAFMLMHSSVVNVIFKTTWIYAGFVRGPDLVVKDRVAKGRDRWLFLFFFLELRTGFVCKEGVGGGIILEPCLSYTHLYNRNGLRTFSHGWKCRKRNTFFTFPHNIIYVFAFGSNQCLLCMHVCVCVCFFFFFPYCDTPWSNCSSFPC